MLTNRSDAVANYHARQATARIERIFINFCDIGRQQQIRFRSVIPHQNLFIAVRINNIAVVVKQLTFRDTAITVIYRQSIISHVAIRRTSFGYRNMCRFTHYFYKFIATIERIPTNRSYAVADYHARQA